MKASELTLGQIAEMLDQPQHRLVHLCEKGVVEPVKDAKGRGTVRRFDLDNVYCLAVALELQRWGLQVVLIRRFVGMLLFLGQHYRKKSGEDTDLIRMFADQEKECCVTWFLPSKLLFDTTDGRMSVDLTEENIPLKSKRQFGWPAESGSGLMLNLTRIAGDLRDRIG
ncbi:hypothetical protein LCGC14_1563670 [marine sediment metagenome]|uniref:HTH merR-type domain-containing protein n=1 Tax=marine sediment metagenome TaxID=412755 RepID=A0A0F9ILR0_9ZZZZ